jgi:hypothetical protein
VLIIRDEQSEEKDCMHSFMLWAKSVERRKRGEKYDVMWPFNTIRRNGYWGSQSFSDWLPQQTIFLKR